MKWKKEKTQNPSSPFNVHSIIGFNLKVPIMNLTASEKQPIIAYASGHILTILDCENNGAEYLLGHEGDIVSIGMAKECKLLVTSDKHLVNIWERREKKNGKLDTVLLKTFNDPMINQPILSAGFSVDGEYLVLASQRCIQLWVLRNGNDRSDAFYELPDDLRIGGKIVFCRDTSQSSSFVVTTVTNLLFCRWNSQKTVLETHSPKPFPDISQIVDTSYCSNYCKGVSITKRLAIIWSDTPPSKEFQPNSFENRMEFQLKIKLGFSQLKTVSCCNGLIIISDCKGEVRFYDESMRLHFVYDLFGEIVCSISFSGGKSANCERQLGYEDSSCIGHFFVACENGRMYKCNLNTKPILISDSAPVFMTCFDLHPKKDILCGGRRDGRIFMYDYSKNMYDKHLSLPLELAKQLKVKPEYNATDCVNFSSCGRYVAAGTSNGYLAIVNAITFKLFQRAVQLAEPSVGIEKVLFSANNEFIVYRDAACTVGLLHYKSTWKLLRKLRIHDTQIVYMSFRESEEEIGLVTISDDYRVVEYTIQNTESGNEVDLSLTNCKRIDFLSILKCCITLNRNIMAFPDRSGNDEAFLTTEEKFKFQIRNMKTFEVMNTFAAPMSENEPITIMCHVHRKNENAIAFSNKNIIGLQHLPIDGNPKKYLAMVGHARKILFMKVSHCNKYLFTIGTDDSSIYKWKIKIPALLEQYRSGGSSLRPFCNLIPDGLTGQLFAEMQDVFFSIQIKLQRDRSIDLKDIQLTDGIPVCEVINFMRGIGFFPNETEIDYLMNEIKYYTNDSSTITFESLLKLFVNYKPPFGYLRSEIHQTLKYLGYSYTMQSVDTEITRERLVEVCTLLGDGMDKNDVAMILNRLDGNAETNAVSDCDQLFNNIRNVYIISEFMKYILGVE